MCFCKKFKFVKIKHFRIYQLCKKITTFLGKNSSSYDILPKCTYFFLIGLLNLIIRVRAISSLEIQKNIDAAHANFSCAFVKHYNLHKLKTLEYKKII